MSFLGIADVNELFEGVQQLAAGLVVLFRIDDEFSDALQSERWFREEYQVLQNYLLLLLESVRIFEATLELLESVPHQIHEKVTQRLPLVLRAVAVRGQSHYYITQLCAQLQELWFLLLTTSQLGAVN